LPFLKNASGRPRANRWMNSHLSNALGRYNFAGQYQQAPALREGGMVKREWFRVYDTAPWLEDYLAELMRFPKSRHDGQVDSTPRRSPDSRTQRAAKAAGSNTPPTRWKNGRATGYSRQAIS
jgi:hypothetical protein